MKTSSTFVSSVMKIGFDNAGKEESGPPAGSVWRLCRRRLTKSGLVVNSHMGLKFANRILATLVFTTGTSEAMGFDSSTRLRSSNRKPKAGTKNSGLLAGLLARTVFAASAIQAACQENHAFDRLGKFK